MVWMMFAVIGISIKQNLGLNETQFGVLVALSVLTSSLIRLPLGMWTDRFGGPVDLAGVRSSAFIMMFGIVWVSLMWIYFTEVRPLAAEQGRKYPESTHFT
jgi:NNP family nitrate/nitrite transporter-like MFS transporter